MPTLENKTPHILFNDKAKYIEGFLCLTKNEVLRLSFIEERITQNDNGDIDIEYDGSTQIIMNRSVAENLAKTILSELDKSK
jgi:hypothetical protein